MTIVNGCCCINADTVQVMYCSYFIDGKMPSFSPAFLYSRVHYIAQTWEALYCNLRELFVLHWLAALFFWGLFDTLA